MKLKPHNLFEYRNSIPFTDKLAGLDEFLDDIWAKREKNSYFNENPDKENENQKFISYLHNKGKTELKSNKYVGVIHYNGERINLLPKIFYDENTSYKEDHITGINTHILWWLSYCRKIKFPSYKTSMGGIKNDFFEILIFLFSKYTKDLLSKNIYQNYEEVDRELPFLKGRLNINNYINDNLSRARWHKVSCTYDEFLLDNEFNRIVKFVCKLLRNVVKDVDSKKNLNDILFILDEVSDTVATAEQCKKIKFNPIFVDFETVRDYCELFLNNYISFNFKNDLKLFAFLLPMEYVFEDFVFGFIEKEIAGLTANSQSSRISLDVANNFTLKPDLILEKENTKYIADCKYKIAYADSKKQGISQTDLYQMLAYAVRLKIDKVLLFYPKTWKTKNDVDTTFSNIQIQDSLADGKIIQIKPFQLVIINNDILEKVENKSLDEIFAETKKKLIESINKAVISFEQKPSIEL